MALQVLITGATGFIGRRLTWDLESEGHLVRILARSSRRARSLFSNTVDIRVGDIRDLASVRDACTGVDIIYHIAGLFRFGIHRRREIYDTNVGGTENLLQAAAEASVQRIVHLSSASVLSKPEDAAHPGLLLSESDFPSKPPRFSPYKFSKWEAERRVMKWARRGLPVVVANLSCPIGYGDEAPTPTGRMIRDFIGGRFPFYCQTGLNFVNVSDVSVGLQLAGAKGRPGERYLLTNANLWLKEFLDLLATQTGLPAPRYCLPHWSVQAMSGFGEIFDLLNPRSTSARLCIETALQASVAQFYDNTKAREELGWSPASIKLGIQEALDWSLNETRASSSPFALSPVRQERQPIVQPE